MPTKHQDDCVIKDNSSLYFTLTFGLAQNHDPGHHLQQSYLYFGMEKTAMPGKESKEIPVFQPPTKPRPHLLRLETSDM